MLVRVILKNFQAHKNLTLDLEKFTTLTGGSNGGKSAVLRAISALVRNESANDYVRYGQKSLSVTLIFSDGYQVEWIKGSGENKYILTHPDGAAQTFDKVGADVPEEVRSVLKLGPIFIKGGDKEYVNFHNQLEAPFIISSTPGSVAKLLGELTSVSKLYSAVNDGNKKVRSTNSLRTTRVHDVRKTKDDLQIFNDLEEYESSLNHAEKVIKEAGVADSTRMSISSVVSKYEETCKSISSLNEVIKSLEDSLRVDISDLTPLSASIHSLESNISSFNQVITDTEKLTKAITYLDQAISTDLNGLKKMNDLVVHFSTLISNTVKANNEIRKLTDKQESLESDIYSIDRSITELVDTLDACPTCNQSLSSEAKIKISEGKVVHAAH